MTDKELRKIANKAVDDWLDTREKVENISNKDMLAILIGTTVGGAITYLVANSKLKKRVKALENEVYNK